MAAFLFTFFFGLIVGSFLGAFTYRFPRGEKISSGRSKCPKCKKTISWYDNIPLLSYILLSGKCRNCGKKISPRYPLIELATGILFVITLKVVHFQSVVISNWEVLSAHVILLALYFLVITSILIVVFIIDFEHQIIPDELVFILVSLSFINILLFASEHLYTHLLWGFLASSFLLLLNILTGGRGMGLGDVKLALFSGFFLGYPQTLVWLFLSFVIGGLIGILLILFGKAKFGRPIPFGPFLVVSFFAVWFCGGKIMFYLFPYL